MIFYLILLKYTVVIMNVNKRLVKELQQLYKQQNEKSLLENDYLIYFDDNNINEVYALIKGPYESVYRHKFIKLNIKIPDNYPHSPPEVFFINYDNVRIHPNMYENGKCCSTILNTWGNDKYEKWTSSMGIETILLTFHSFLDYDPYTYEPGGRDDPSYTVYVLYESWYTCLIRYIENERIPLFNKFMANYIVINLPNIIEDLQKSNIDYPFGNYYTRCFEVDNYIINYDRILSTLQYYYNYLEEIVNNNSEESSNLESQNIDKIDRFGQYDCNICFDSDSLLNLEYTILDCNHKFHKNCLKHHIEQNSTICSMCRKELTQNELVSLEDKQEDLENHIEDLVIWVTNPVTKRKIKKGGKTYKQLIEDGTIPEVD
jgi:ubiquitin-protein ligase